MVRSLCTIYDSCKTSESLVGHGGGRHASTRVAGPAGPSTGSDLGGDPLAHKKKKRKEENIEIPITPMLDMAFQLLTFFILTYHPMPSEGQFVMNLMPAAPATDINAQSPETTQANPDVPAALRTLPTTLRAGEGGNL